MPELREILGAGPVLIRLSGDEPRIIVGAWAFSMENGLAWAVAGFNMTPSQQVHFIPSTVKHTGGSEWTWTDDTGAEYELTPAEPAISVDLNAQVQAWQDYRQRNPESTSRESAREQAAPATDQVCAARDPRPEQADEIGPAHKDKSRKARYLWVVVLLARIYEAFPLTCPLCVDEMRIIAFVTAPASIEAILAHIGEPTRPPCGRDQPAKQASVSAASLA